MPRIKQIRHVDFSTGKTVAIDVVIPEDASVEERFNAMIEGGRAATGGMEPALMAVVCDGCGLRVEIDSPGLPEGWITRPGGEFCTRCR